MAKLIAALALICSLLLAGCSGGGGDGDSSSSTSSSSGTSSGPGGNGTGNGTGAPAPIVLTGMVSGAQDCTLEAQGQSEVSAADVAIPAEASNRSYALTFSGGQPAPGFTGCIGFAGGAITGGMTGTIPDGATAAQIAVNLGQGRTYTLTIT